MFRVSVDVGGTFTDLVALDEATGEMVNIKVPTTPRSPEAGVVDAFRSFLEGAKPASVGMVSHATTIATNALFGQLSLELPRTALITTRGFRDVVEIGRQRRAEVYNLFFQRPPMLVARRLRYEVDERTEASGDVSKPLDRAQLDAVLDEVEAEGVESLAVAFLNSYANPVNEEEALNAVKERGLAVYTTASSRISNEYREYERFSTAVVNAVLMPIIHAYVTALAREMKGLGVAAPLYVMQSNGGLSTAENVSQKPVTIVESGPSAGVIAAAWLGEATGEQNLISFDMGGTTAKAGTVRGRMPEVVPEYEVAGHIHMGRLVKGSGYPVRFPFIDLAECSAGGGTIAWVDEGGVMRVGPTSAGASPGPACYSRGGTEPTITDANLLLGRLNPESLLGGGMKIYADKAEEAFKRLSSKLDTDAHEAAVGVVRLANSMMSKILRIVSVERGYDPRGFSIVAFGGAGPMHVCALADELGVGKVLVPPNPGMFSALGLLTADLFHDYARAMVSRFDEVDAGRAEASFMEMEEEGRETLASEGVEPVKMTFIRQVDLRYLGQAYELTVEVPRMLVGSLSSVAASFHAKHREVYGYAAEDEPVELVNLRVRAVGLIPKPRLREHRRGVKPSPSSRRRVYFEGPGEWVDTPVYVREQARWGKPVKGPAIVEQYDATTVVYPGWEASMDGIGDLILRRLRG
jgi:N-methylhydantoinase A